MRTKVFIKNKLRKETEFQFFMHQFVEAGIRKGVTPMKEVNADSGLHKVLRKVCYHLPMPPFQRKKALIITALGGNVSYSAYPYYNYEIIPMIWDVWPFTWDLLYHDIRQLKCKMVFVTAKQIAEKIERDLGIKAIWIPEGIDIKDYKKGEPLMNRNIDVYEMGRQYDRYHTAVMNLLHNGVIKEYRGNINHEDGSFTLAFETAQDLLDALSHIKVITCFPQCDTHPQRAGNVETLTQRYWEAMLSGCLIVGRAPQELIDLIGYNPVIDIDWNESEKQLENILKNIADYQDLVDRNYEAAQKYASWDNRWDGIVEILRQNGYMR